METELPLCLDDVLNVRLATGAVPACRKALEKWSGGALPEAPFYMAWTENGARRILAGDRTDLQAACAPPEAQTAARRWFGLLERPPRPLIAGIINVTPDSFSDGGRFTDPDAAMGEAFRQAEAGADLIDLGGESTRPGAQETLPQEEIGRLVPVLKKLRGRLEIPLSVDTRHAATARACLDEGATWINDVSGLVHDPEMVDLAAEHPEVNLVIMHSTRPPEEERLSTEYSSASEPVYGDLVADSLAWLRRQAALAIRRGVPPGKIWLDPGFGFGKSYRQNLTLLVRLREYCSAGLPLYLGVSRKSSVGRLAGDLPPAERLMPSAAAVAWSVQQGAVCHRVHDVAAMRQVVDAAYGLMLAGLEMDRDGSGR